MANSRKVDTMTRAPSAFAVIAAVLMLFSIPATPTAAADGKLSDADQTCLGCHSNADFKKDLGNGKSLSLHVAGDAFAKSVHGAMGCAGCHSDIDVAKHSSASREIKDPRDYSIAMAGVCRQCHAEEFKQYEASNHASLLRNGNLWAPVCTDCHGSHAVTPRTAYDTCVGCHASAMDGHQKWLPNARLHLEVVSCAACHAPAVQRMVDLRLYDTATQKWVTEKEGQPQFEKTARSADTDGNGLDAMELRKLLAEINRGGKPGQITFRGRIELRKEIDAHQLSDKSKALRTCDNCHREGAEPFQNVTVSIIGADGKTLRYNAHKDVLSSVLSVDTLRLFYAIGGTRNKVLDILLILAVLGGLAVPIGHQTMKRLVARQTRKEEEAARAAGQSQTQNPSRPGNAPDDSDARK